MCLARLIVQESKLEDVVLLQFKHIFKGCDSPSQAFRNMDKEESQLGVPQWKTVA